MNLTALTETNFQFSGQTGRSSGKVRDIYFIREDLLVLIATDRISAFDVILPRPIPYKGEILNQIAAWSLENTRDILPNWLIEVVDPAASVGYRCKPYPVEMVIRGYLCGHAWREYSSGKREICGVLMPDGMKQNEKFPEPIITPTIKANDGHDLDISKQEIIVSGRVPEDEYIQLEDYTRKLYERGTELAAKQGLILVDTKYEFGNRLGEIYLIDEVHTPDSSRYFHADVYEKNQRENLPQKQLSKEFVREWLMENGFRGNEGDVMPAMTDDVVQRILDRYVELFEKFTNQKFQFSERNDLNNRINNNIDVNLKKIQLKN